MFGYLRLLLAILVVLSHLKFKVGGFHPGVFAVVLFYILAGYVVTDLITRIFKPGKGSLLRFYAERILRIFPLYWYFASLTVLFLIFTHFGEPAFTAKRVLNNLSIVPLNYYQWFDVYILQNPQDTFIPPAWSLGVEIQAYVLIPILLRHRAAKILVAIASLLVFVGANVFSFYPEELSYRFLCGTLFIFLLGSSIYRINKASVADYFDYLLIWGSCILCALGLILSGFLGNSSDDYVTEGMMGVIIGVPLIFYLSRNLRELPLNRVCGDFSYGIFLAHFLSLWCLRHFFPMLNVSSLRIRMMVILFSLILSFPGIYWIEKPLFRFRKKLTKMGPQS